MDTIQEDYIPKHRYGRQLPGTLVSFEVRVDICMMVDANRSAGVEPGRHRADES